jgi:hypothetical protein
LRPVEVAQVDATDLAESLVLLEEAVRDGDPISKDFADRLRKAIVHCAQSFVDHPSSPSSKTLTVRPSHLLR